MAALLLDGARTRRFATWGCLFLAVVAMGAVMLSTRAAGAVPFDVTVTASPGAATDVVDLEGSTFAQATTALADAENSGTATIPVDLPGLPDITSSGALASIDNTSRSVAIQGGTTVLSTPAQVLVTATWATATDTDPDVAVLVRFDSIGLSAFDSSWTSVPVTFGPAIVGLTDTAHTIEPSNALGTELFLSDGLVDTDDSFALADTGVSFSAVVASGDLTEAAEQLGGATASGVRLRGTLATSLAVLGGSGGDAGLDLSVDIPVTTPATFPDWVDLTSPWTVSLAADAGGNFSAGFSGGLTVSPDGSTPITATGSATVAVSGGSPSLTLDAGLGPVPDLFGQTWLDLNGANLTATIATSGFSGGIDASLTLGPVTADVALELAVANGSVNATLDLSATGPVSSTDIIDAIGASTTGIDPSVADVTLNQVALHVAVDKPQGEQASVTVAFFGDASITVNNGTFDAQMLFRTETGSSSLLVAARLDSPSLQDLDPTIPFDWLLPDIALVVSNLETTLAYADMDTPTQLYFAPVVCEDPTDETTCGDLDVKQGLVVQATIELPEDLKSQLGELGITVTGPIELTGTLPILGGTELSLDLALPQVLGADEDLVKSGQVSFRIAKIGTSVEASINGEMVFRVSRASADSCDGTEDGTWAAGGCYDELTFTVALSVNAVAGPPPSVEIELVGQVTDWDNAFGVSWLDVHDLRMELGLKAGGGTAVSVDVGMTAGFVIGAAPEATDVRFSIAFTATPAPPFFTLTGFTAGSNAGISLQQVASTFDPSFDAGTLPDLSLRNLWIAYGVTANEDLCIRQGFFISAELHLDTPPVSVTEPGCTPGVTLPDDPADLPTAGCEATNTCLAAILIDVQTGVSPSFTAAGFIRGFEAGPITIDNTTVAIEISADEQRFYLSGGASITDITGATDDVWASGDLEIDFRNSAGDASLFISGTVNIGGTEGLTATLTGTAAADFSALGDGDITAFLASLDFDLEYELTFPALEEFGDQVTAAFTPVSDWIDTTGDDITDAFDPDSNDDLQSFLDLFEPVSDAPEYEFLQGYTGELGTTSDLLALQAAAYYNYISDYWQLRFYDVIFADGSRQNARIYFMNQVGIRLRAAINNAGGIGNITLYGIDEVLIPAQDIGDIEEIKDFRIRVTGVCFTPGSVFAGSTLCTDGVTALSETTLAVLAADLFTEQTTYTLPTGTVAARQAQAVRLAAAAVGTPPANAIEAISRLDDAFVTGALEVTCATVSVHYSPDGNTQDPAVVSLNAYGTPASIEVKLDPQNPRRPIAPQEVVQDTINTVLSATTPPEPCSEPEQPIGPGGTTVVASERTIDEGDTATVSGVADPAFFGTQITVTWGDGDTSVATASAADGSWTATHVYQDDAGPGSSKSFLVSATAAGVVDFNYTRITVVNVAPTLTLGPVAASVDEGATLTVTGSFSDPGVLDTHTLVVSWADGSPSETLTFPAHALKSFTLTHTFVDDNPTLTPSDGKVVTVKLVDNDGGQAVTQQPVTIVNVAPSDVQLDAVSVDGVDATVDADGRFVVPEAGSITISGSLRDVGRADTHRVAIDWGDESRGDTAVVVRDATDPTLVRFTATHVYVDDDPTTSDSDVYTITMIASDDDTGRTDVEQEIRVADVAPVVTVDPIAGTTENVGITMTAAFTDVGTVDTHTAVVDWGDGTPLETLTIAAGAMSANHTYGDNGLFTVTVTVTDDDSLSDSASTTVTVVNTVPTVAIDRSGTTTFDGVQTVVGSQNVATPFAGPITDPGSDDVTVTWAFGDGRVNTLTNLVNPPGSDPAVSPSIQPRSFTSSVSNAYARPCLYTAMLSATDDDGGVATPDSVPVVVVGSPKGWQQSGYWKNAYSGRSTIPAADLACYLRIIEHTSQLFGPGDLIPLARPADVQVLFKDTTLSAELFDRDILVAWLNVANGALPLSQRVDVNGDGTPDATVAQVLADAELVRLNPASTKSQIDAARKTVTDLQKVAIR